MSVSQKLIRLLIADDHQLIREGIKNIFTLSDTIEVIGTACNGEEAINVTNSSLPDVILMDIKMPVMNGPDATFCIRQKAPTVKVIALSMFDDEQHIIQMRLAGASGYLLKYADSEEITAAITAVYSGGEYYCTSVREQVDVLFRTGKLGIKRNESKACYSEIELTIIQLICKEFTSKEIADKLKISKRTVEHQKEKIQEKMGVHSSVGIAVHAATNWLL